MVCAALITLSLPNHLIPLYDLPFLFKVCFKTILSDTERFVDFSFSLELIISKTIIEICWVSLLPLLDTDVKFA